MKKPQKEEPLEDTIATPKACAIGIPVLASDVGDMRLVLEEYGSGLVSNEINQDGKSELRLKEWKRFVQNLQSLQSCVGLIRKHIISRFGSITTSEEYAKLSRHELIKNKIGLH